MKKALIGLLTLSLTGCATMGPSVVKTGHRPYNQALASSVKEQMLLNIVRLKYRENPYILDVSGITSSYILGANAGVEYKMQPKATLNNTITPRMGLAYEERPTISYKPLEGKDFVKQMLLPVSSKNMLTMAESGWSLERVLSLCVERVNHLYNAPSASGPTPDYAPEYKEFARWTAVMRQLQKGNMLEMGKDPRSKNPERRDMLEELGIDPDGKDNLYLGIREKAGYEAEVSEFLSLLGAPEGTKLLKFGGNFLRHKGGEVTMRTRSLMGIMFYLSQGIQVPQDHIKKGLVTVTPDENGGVFDWNQLGGKFLTILSSKTEPKGTDLKVKYRGYWFYVAGNDLNSKSTFMVLSKLFNLQNSSSGGNTPILSIPVN